VTAWSFHATGKLFSSGGSFEVVGDTGQPVATVELTSGRIGRATWAWTGPSPRWSLAAPGMFRRTYTLTVDGLAAPVKIHTSGTVRPKLAAVLADGREFRAAPTAGVDRELDLVLDDQQVAHLTRATTSRDQQWTSREHWVLTFAASVEPETLTVEARAVVEAATVMIDQRRRQREGQD